MGEGRLETHVITLPLSTDGWMDGAKKRPSSRREKMCHVFDSTLRLYVQTAYGRDGGWLLQVEAVAVLPPCRRRHRCRLSVYQ